jgi:hypothetical protein
MLRAPGAKRRGRGVKQGRRADQWSDNWLAGAGRGEGARESRKESEARPRPMGAG